MKFACRFFEKDKLLAACDKEILGKKLKFGEIEIEIKESFYFERFYTEREIKEFLKEAKIINLFGNKIVALATEQKLINKENIKVIDGIAHVQIYKV